MKPETVTLYRPVGPQEFDLVRASGFERWPPRLPEQPIFYPVTSEDYAREITVKWNVPEYSVGYVTGFEVNKAFMDRYDVHQVGAAHHTEWWIPAEDLDELNDNIVGEIEVVGEYPRDDLRQALESGDKERACVLMALLGDEVLEREFAAHYPYRLAHMICPLGEGKEPEEDPWPGGDDHTWYPAPRHLEGLDLYRAAAEHPGPVERCHGLIALGVIYEHGYLNQDGDRVRAVDCYGEARQLGVSRIPHDRLKWLHWDWQPDQEVAKRLARWDKKWKRGR